MKQLVWGVFAIGMLVLFSACEDDTLFWGALNQDKQARTDSVVVLPHPNLKGMVFLMGRKVPGNTCLPDSSCECCLERLIFVNDSEFVSIAYCQKNESYVRGRYHYLGSRIVLNFGGFRKEKLHLGTVENKNRESEVKSERQVETNHWELNYFECEGRPALVDEGNVLVGLKQEESAESWKAQLEEMGI